MNPAFWNGKRVFVTGHTGFKGSWLALWLTELGACVTGFALAPPTRPCLYELAAVGRVIEDRRGDIRDAVTLRKALVEARPEVVIHLAAQSLVRASYREPVNTYMTNVIGTAHLLEAARGCDSVRAVVVVTSDKIYENREWLWGYRENEALGGRDPYSSSKACAELVTAAYRESFFSSSTDGIAAIGSARAGNVIGGGDWAADRLLPDAIGAFVESRPLLVRYPAGVRPWQHVLDPLHGYVMLAERLAEQGRGFAEAWNFGPDDSAHWTNARIADRLVGLWGDGARWRQAEGAQPHEASLLQLDSAKARARLGWAPRLALDDALDWTVAWYRAWRDGSDLGAITRQQINWFQERAPTGACA